MSNKAKGIVLTVIVVVLVSAVLASIFLRSSGAPTGASMGDESLNGSDIVLAQGLCEGKSNCDGEFGLCCRNSHTGANNGLTATAQISLDPIPQKVPNGYQVNYACTGSDILRTAWIDSFSPRCGLQGCSMFGLQNRGVFVIPDSVNKFVSNEDWNGRLTLSCHAKTLGFDGAYTWAKVSWSFFLIPEANLIPEVTVAPPPLSTLPPPVTTAPPTAGQRIKNVFGRIQDLVSSFFSRIRNII